MLITNACEAAEVIMFEFSSCLVQMLLMEPVWMAAAGVGPRWGWCKAEGWCPAGVSPECGSLFQCIDVK